MYLVLEGFKFSLLDSNHMFTLSMVTFILCVASFKEGADVITVVSSANFTNLAVVSQLFMSLTYIRKSMNGFIELFFGECVI